MDQNQLEQIKRIIKVLKVDEFSIFLGRTNHGDLSFKIRKADTEGVFTLDSVPLDKEVNDALLKILLK